MFANIDVIIPCYNAEQTLSRAVQSVLSQTYLGKIWLVDDGSKDSTLALAQEWVEQYPEKIVVEFAWQHMRMTCGGSVVFRRAFFLACGGFPQDELFRQLGGEDGALGIATTKIAKVATLFNDVGVLHYCRDGMHAERLLDAILFQKAPQGITEEQMAQANGVTDEICRQINALKCGLNSSEIGIRPLVLERTE